MMLCPAALGTPGTQATTGAKRARQERVAAPADWWQQISRELQPRSLGQSEIERNRPTTLERQRAGDLVRVRSVFAVSRVGDLSSPE